MFVASGLELLTQSSQKYRAAGPWSTFEAPAVSAARCAPFPYDLAALLACRSAILLTAACVKCPAAGVETARLKPNRSEQVTATSRTERTANDALVRWTEEEVSTLSESDTCLLMQMAMLRSTPHDLFIIRWCTAHLRKLQDAVDYSHGAEPPERPAP